MEVIQNTDHILEPKASLNMFQRIKIIQNTISDHSVIKLETCEKGGKKEQNSSF